MKWDITPPKLNLPKGSSSFAIIFARVNSLLIFGGKLAHTVDGRNPQQPVEVGSLSHYLQSTRTPTYPWSIPQASPNPQMKGIPS